MGLRLHEPMINPQKSPMVINDRANCNGVLFKLEGKIQDFILKQQVDLKAKVIDKTLCTHVK